jgi:hypothetical protein
MYALLTIMPENPISIPITIGGGLAIGLIMWRL